MEQIKTARLTMTLTDISGLPALEEIDRESGEYFSFDPRCELNHNCSLTESLTIGDNPLDAKDDFKRENCRFYTVWLGGKAIGYVSYYLEYKKKDAVYLSVLYIKEAFRKCGVGAEVLEALTKRFAAENYKSVCLHCSLRNATSLRFWVSNGFDRILNVECTGNLYPDEFGGLELMKSIG